MTSNKLPSHIIRPEFNQLRNLGYDWEYPHDVVDIFEKKVANFAGSKYAIAVDCDTHGIFLVLKYLNTPTSISIPKYTYMSVPMVIHHAGYEFEFDNREWSGIYQLNPLPIVDGAGRWKRDMFVGGDNFQILSFQAKKRLPIGRGGMILTNDETAYKWLKKMCYDGRDLNKSQQDDDITEMGYHMYMTPEDAARGILIMNELPQVTDDLYTWKNYKDLTLNTVFKK